MAIRNENAQGITPKEISKYFKSIVEFLIVYKEGRIVNALEELSEHEDRVGRNLPGRIAFDAYLKSDSCVILTELM